MIETAPCKRRLSPVVWALVPVLSEVQTAYDSISRATRAVVTGGSAVRSLPVSSVLRRIIGVTQGRDAFDQRMAHVLEILVGHEGRGAAVSTAAAAVAAAQIGEVSDNLRAAAAEARAVFDKMPLLAGDRAARNAFRAAGRDGSEAARALDAAAAALAAIAVSTAPARAQPGAALADLDWIEALYTMDDERRVHRSAVARLAG